MYYVICNDDTAPDGTPGKRILATSKEFASRSSAERYAAGVSRHRFPAVVGPDDPAVLAIQIRALVSALEWALPLARDAALLHPSVQANPNALRAVLAQVYAAEAAIAQAQEVGTVTREKIANGLSSEFYPCGERVTARLHPRDCYYCDVALRSAQRRARG